MHNALPKVPSIRTTVPVKGRQSVEVEGFGSSGEVSACSRLELSSERLVHNIAKLFAVLQVEGAVAPGRAQLLESWTVGLGVFGLGELDVVAGYAVANWALTRQRFFVKLEKIVQADAVVALSSILLGIMAEFVVHLSVEVADEEVRPELVENVHVVRAGASSGILTRTERLFV